MEHSQLKPLHDKVLLGVGLVTIFLSAMIIFAVLADDRTEDKVFATVWLANGTIQVILYLRTGNRAQVFWMLGCFLIACSYITGYKGIFFFAPAALLLVIDLYFRLSRRLRWKYRDILQVAAHGVQDVTNGFTHRSLPVGKVSTSKKELQNFGRFLSSHLIAFPFHTSIGTYFCINSTGSKWFMKPKQKKDTYVLFHRDGSVEVNLAKAEYSQYREAFAFDQLCQSLGNLFIEFLDQFKNGKTKHILRVVNQR